MRQVADRSDRPGTSGRKPGEGPVLVFLGPTLPRIEAEEALSGAVFLHPVSQGDIILAAHAFRPRAMILIDGQFEDRPPVRHKEILWAMAQGIAVIGAASMGAIRAAELYPFGMVGIGLIYRWYRRWPLAPDDAVAVQSAPAELGFLPLTDALLDLQKSFSRWKRDKLIPTEERHRLTRIAQGMNFRERTLTAILREASLPGEVAEKLDRKMVRQKRLDALEALQRTPFLIDAARCAKNYPWTATNTFIRDLESGGIDPHLLEY